MLASVRHRRLQVAKLRAAVVAGTLEAVREHAILCEQRADRVGELNFAPGSGHGLRQVMKNARCQDRSEEHTSELQSRPHLVCRLLLEKKKVAVLWVPSVGL